MVLLFIMALPKSFLSKKVKSLRQISPRDGRKDKVAFGRLLSKVGRNDNAKSLFWLTGFGETSTTSLNINTGNTLTTRLAIQPLGAFVFL